MSDPYADENGQFSWDAVRNLYALYRHPEEVEEGPGTGHGGWQATARMLRLGRREAVCGFCNLVVPASGTCECR